MIEGMDSSDQSRQTSEERFRRLIDVGTALLSELDLEAVLMSVVEAARELTSARYAALGVLDRDGRELERFIYLGIDDETKRAIGNLPRGRGVLGLRERLGAESALVDGAGLGGGGLGSRDGPSRALLGSDREAAELPKARTRGHLGESDTLDL
jgi:GAF domain-containing protein